MGSIKASYVVVIEDNPHHFEILKRLLLRNDPELEILWLKNLAESNQWLENLLQNDTKSSRTPNLILLDIGLPDGNGLNVLHKIKSSPYLRCLIVIVMTSSLHPMDVQNAYESYANGYILKPGRLEDYQQVVQALKKYWLEHNQIIPLDPQTDEKEATN